MNAKEQILEAADQLFGESGFENTTTRQIAEKSGVNKMLINYHFKSKDGLLETIIDRHYERLAAMLRREMDMNLTPQERIPSIINGYFDFLVENLSFSRIIQREVAGGRHQDIVRKHIEPLFNIGAEIMEPDINDEDLSASQLIISFFGMIITYFTYSSVLDPLMGDDPLSPENLDKRKKHIMKMFEIVKDSMV